MKDTLPISVIVPTLNSASLISAHLESMEPWLDMVEEVIVVDSYSEDATVELIRTRLQHPALKILTHPRGLYQSWNHGIREASAKYIYMSTVGDAITRQGLEHLYDTCERLDCDVAISKPLFIDEDGKPIADKTWPIDDILSTLDVKVPIRIEGLPLLLFTALNITGAILGSSASNLYRTDIVQKTPFPTDFGTAGDVGWGIIRMLTCRLGVTPLRFSTFREHVKAYAPSVYAVESINSKLFALVCVTWEAAIAKEPDLETRARANGIQALLDFMKGHIYWHERLVKERKRPLPWFLNPKAWIARHRKAKAIAAVFRGKGVSLRESMTAGKLAALQECGLLP